MQTRTRRSSLPAAILLVAGLTGACSSSGSGSSGSGPPPDVQVCLPGDLEGCYAYSEMQQLVDELLPLVEKFFDKEYAAMPHPEAYV